MVEPPRVYERLDEWSQWLLLGMVVVSPWLFGTTPGWAIWGMSGMGYVLGVLLLLKRTVRWRWHYRPPRWGEEARVRGQPGVYRPSTRVARWLTRVLGLLTVLVLAYTLTAALNWRSRFEDGIQVFNDRCVRWLPFSYDAPATWSAFWVYLGLAGFFWALRDWLLGKSLWEQGEAEETFPAGAGGMEAGLPQRLSKLLWVLVLNGTVLGAVSILQRLDGTGKLLWLVEPRYGHALFHFGPFPYRGNAAQYFNLLWPIGLAFWWTLFRAGQTSERVPVRVGDDPHWVLLPCVLILMACPIISASHGGAVITLCLAVGALGVAVVTNWRASWRMRLGITAPFLVAVSLVGYLGWSQYQRGLTSAFADDLGDRIQIYENARQMAADHPWYGTGPGTFPAVYQIYRPSLEHQEAAYAHNDWLQTRITFGWIGFGAILLMLVHPVVRWWIRDGIYSRWDFAAMLILAMGGSLFHARFDFPFQIYSIVLLFLVLAAMGGCLSRRG
ncbi:MAG TPA: O-antigen ligase family protein [Verrucomicrobiota bacterium]|nr:O-antigen ligase family protein [Verrucomicrobiota bacterium]HNU53073.1 O-antigen ligase family protein [Verrucomicrobiota bacterium]